MEDPVRFYQRGIQSRTDAIYHVQFELDQEAIQRQLEGFEHYREVHISGLILRLFRGDWEIQPGDPVSARLFVVSRGFMAIPGPWVGVPLGELTGATHIEAYLDHQPSHRPLGQFDFEFLENGPTDAPVMNIEQLQRSLAAFKGRFVSPEGAPGQKKRLRQAEGAGPLAELFEYLRCQQIKMKF